mmetsp:Transcript_84528/g.137002  ORF Transcript_84528/g.137002 Transcript_84528/m.137002 type:complete len:128 (+) Transcript_84528:182-565(+)
MYACREQIVSECCIAGLDPLDEEKLGFSLSQSTRSPSGLPFGVLLLLDAAVAVGAVRVVYSAGLWNLHRGIRMAEDGGVLLPSAVDVSIRCVVDLQILSMNQGENVRDWPSESWSKSLRTLHSRFVQ